jgi:hypothetical protein
MFVDRNKDPNILENIEKTKITTIKQSGYIAKLNKDKTEILNVYLDRKTAAKYNEYLSSYKNAVTSVKKREFSN